MPFIKIKKDLYSLNGKRNRKAPQNASLTIEAALAFPLVLFVFLFFLSFFRVMQVEQMTEEALALAGAKVSLEAIVNPDGDSDGGNAASDTALYAKALSYFHEELGRQSCPVKHVVGGNSGFSFAGTKMQNEHVDLRLEYRISIPGGMLTRTIPVQQRAYLKKWTGFHGDADDGPSGDWVYVTETGTVYHLNRECTHLRLSIHALPSGQAIASYSPCQICGRTEGHMAYYYVTNEGGRYHARLDCSGLKRTVYMIQMSEVRGKGRCSRCGG